MSKFYGFLYKCLGGIVRRLYRVRITGAENEPENGPFIVCANHLSNHDVVILAASMKHQIRFAAKAELFKIPLLAQLIKVLGAFPIDRGGSDVGAIKKAVNIVKDGKCLGIFPQGHRYPGEDPRTTKTKNGMALIATRAEADIVPCYIWRKNNKFRLFGRTYIIVGDPIAYETLGYDPEGSGEYARITEIVFDRICTMGEEFDKSLKRK